MINGPSQEHNLGYLMGVPFSLQIIGIFFSSFSTSH